MLLSVSLVYYNSVMSASSSKQRRRKPRGIWKVQRVTLPRPPARESEPWHPRFTSDNDDSDAASSSSTASNKQTPYSPSENTNEEDIHYWSHSRRCSPHPDRVSSWVARTRIMDTSTTARRGSQSEQGTTDFEDWEDLKDLFAKAAEQYESALSVLKVDRDLRESL